MPHDTPLIATIVAGLGLAFVLGLPPTGCGCRRSSAICSPACDRAVHAGFRGRPEARQRAGRARRHPADVRRRPAFLAEGPAGGARHRRSRRHRPDRGARRCSAWRWRWALGWTLGAGLVFGLALSVASTVVLLQALQERRLLETERGRIAVGWLIVEDLVMVLTLVLLPPLAGFLGGRDAAPSEPWASSRAGHAARSGARSLITACKVAAFVALMLVVGRAVIPWILHYVAHTGSRELFRLAVLAVALGVAFGAASAVRRVVRARRLLRRHGDGRIPAQPQAAEETLPLRDAFAVLFFVSVGMLFNPACWWSSRSRCSRRSSSSWSASRRRLSHRAAVRLSASRGPDDFREPRADRRVLLHPHRAGRQLEIVPEEARDLVVAGAILSILVNPLLFLALERLGVQPGSASGDHNPIPGEGALPSICPSPKKRQPP